MSLAGLANRGRRVGVVTKLGIGGVVGCAVLQLVAYALVPPQGPPTDTLSFVDSVLRQEAVTSLNMLSAAALVTGLLALLFAGYRRLRPTASPNVISPAAPFGLGAVARLSLRAEATLMLGLVAALFIVNLATIEIYPLVWLDETGYTDPGLNLAIGNGLTTSIWGHVYWGKFWFSYPPLYPYLIAGWISGLGISLAVVRSLNLVLISAAAIALWYYALRSGWFPGLLGRIAVALLPLLGYYVSYTYRSGRPDALCALLAALALLASLVPDRRRRVAALIAIGALVPWAGLQLMAFAVVIAVLLFIWWPRRTIAIFLPLGGGIGLGLLALLGFYAANHSLYGFLASTFGSFHTITGQLAQHVVMQDPRSLRHFGRLPALLLAVVFEDRSTVLVATGGVLMLLVMRQASQSVAFKASRFAVTAAFGVPILMELAGQYWFQYTWMGLLAVGIPTIASIETAPKLPELAPVRALAMACVAAALVIGLPQTLIRAWDQRSARDYNAVRTYVRAQAAPGDWVYSSPEPYFALAEIGAVPVSLGYASGHLAPDIPDDQRRRIKLFIVHPDEVQGAIERLGGNWQPSAPPLVRPQATALTRGEMPGAYQLVAYRRQ